MPKATAMILGDIYDAWRAQDLDWLASYLPNDFAHIINVPAGIGPTAGSCYGKKAVIDRWHAVMADFEFLMFDTSGLMTERNRAAAEIPFRIGIARRASCIDQRDVLDTRRRLAGQTH
jgi:hypothetical protein